MNLTSIAFLLVLAFHSAAVAQETKDGEMASKTLPTVKLVRISAQGKTFTMGSPKGELGVMSDETEHAVTLNSDYYLGVTPVTRGQFAAFVTDTGVRTDAEEGAGGTGWDQDQKDWIRDKKFSWRNPGHAQTDEHPVVNVSWNDALAFCNWLGKKDGQEYRLPTEAEWEFACRAGSTTRFGFGDDGEAMSKYANVADAKFREITGMTWGIKKSDGYAFTAPVAQFQPNAFGLFDLHGNAMQWCSDVFGDYPKEPVTDPRGPEAGANSPRVIRGGCWRNEPVYCRSASRYKSPPTGAGLSTGFRLAAPVP